MDAPKDRRKHKHAKRRAHQREQAAKKKQAIAEAEHAARCLSKTGDKLKKERTGKAYETAFFGEMNRRGYMQAEQWRTTKSVGKKPVTERVTIWIRRPQLEPEHSSASKRAA